MHIHHDKSIRRRPDGSIDTDRYVAEGMRLQRSALRGALQNAFSVLRKGIRLLVGVMKADAGR